MHEIKTVGHEFVPDDDGGHFEEHVEIKEIPDDKVRHNDWCTLCGWSTYPECLKTCTFKNAHQNRD